MQEAGGLGTWTGALGLLALPLPGPHGSPLED